MRLPNTRADVTMRQEAVRELVANEDLFAKLEALLTAQPIFNYDPDQASEIHYTCRPETVKTYIDSVVALAAAAPKTRPFVRAIRWAEAIRSDSLFVQLYLDKQTAKQRRIFSVHDEEYDGTRFGILKPGVNPEDVFDYVSEDLLRDPTWRPERVGKEPDKALEAASPEDIKKILAVTGRARARYDVLNTSTAETLLRPMLLLHSQLTQLYRCAKLYHRFEKHGAVTFPEFGERIELYNTAPTNKAIENLVRPQKMTRTNIQLNHTITNIEGRSKSGKTEMLRTIWMSITLMNAGGPLPAESARMPHYPGARLIRYKGDVNYQGSEFEGISRRLMSEMTNWKPREAIFIDEFGDSTRDIQALKAAQRLFPELLRNGNQIFLTTQHTGIDDYVRELKGETYTLEGFHLTVAKGPIDCRPDETLDAVGWTRHKIREHLRMGAQHDVADAEETDEMSIDEGPMF
jgi:hypothetical protein